MTTLTRRTGAEDGPRQRPRPLSWALGLVLVVLVGMAIASLATNEQMQWSVVGDYFLSERILHGVQMTLVLTLIAMVIGIVLGGALAVMRLSDNPLFKVVASVYVTIFRGVPVLIQILFWFNAALIVPKVSVSIPGVWHWSEATNEFMTPMLAAILSLGLNQAAYTSEVIRSGILSVSYEQRQAGLATGMTPTQVFFRVVLPQAVRVMIPPIGNEVIGMLKTTSLVSVIAMDELLHASQLIYSRSGQVVPLLLVAAIWYLIVTMVLAVVQRQIEQRIGRGLDRSVTARKVAREEI